MAAKTIDIHELLDKESAVLPMDGEVLYTRLLALKSNENEFLILNFKGLKFVTSAFLNASIGKFLLENPKLKDKLNFSYVPEQGLDFRIQRVVEVATNKRLREAHNRAIEEVIA